MRSTEGTRSRSALQRHLPVRSAEAHRIGPSAVIEHHGARADHRVAAVLREAAFALDLDRQLVPAVVAAMDFPLGAVDVEAGRDDVGDGDLAEAEPRDMAVEALDAVPPQPCRREKAVGRIAPVVEPLGSGNRVGRKIAPAEARNGHAVPL